MTSALDYWTAVAEDLQGHQVVVRDRDSVILWVKPQKTSHTAWGIGALIILVAALFTFGLSLVLFLPYLVVWAAVAGRRRNWRQTYRLSVDPDGRPVTGPSNMVWSLLAAERGGRWNR